jgi:hypothetical protein
LTANTQRSLGSSRTASKRRFVVNSSDCEDKLSDSISFDPVPKVSKPTRSSGRRLLDSVQIPTPMAAKKGRGAVIGSSASSAASSMSTRDNSVAYDTPNTTAMNTPAGDFGSFSVSSGPAFTLGGSSLLASTKRKRGRPASKLATNITNDEELARQLQDEEYGGSRGTTSHVTNNKTRRGRPLLAITDTETEEDDGDEEVYEVEVSQIQGYHVGLGHRSSNLVLQDHSQRIVVCADSF